MKILIYFLGLLVSSIINTFLQDFVFPGITSAAANDSQLLLFSGFCGIITAAIYAAGIFIIPRKLIARWNKRPRRPVPDDPPADDIILNQTQAKADIQPTPEPALPSSTPVLPESVDETTIAPPSDIKRSGSVKYHAIISVLSIALAACCVLCFRQYRNAEDLRDWFNDQYSIRYDEGFTEGHASGYSDGFTSGLESGYAQGYEEGYAKGVGAEPITDGEIVKQTAYECTHPFEITIEAIEEPQSAYCFFLEFISPYPDESNDTRTQKTQALGDLSGIPFYSFIGFCRTEAGSTTINVPPGRYKLWYCTGRYWTGIGNGFFAEDLQWYTAEELFTFFDSGNEQIGCSITVSEYRILNHTTHPQKISSLPEWLRKLQE